MVVYLCLKPCWHSGRQFKAGDYCDLDLPAPEESRCWHMLNVDDRPPPRGEVFGASDFRGSLCWAEQPGRYPHTKSTHVARNHEEAAAAPPPPKDQPAQPWLDTSSDESYARTLKALKAWQRGELAEPVIDPQDGAIAAADLLPPQGDLPTGDELPAEKEAPAEATAPASKTGNTGEGVEAPELPTVEEGEESDGA